MKGFKNIPGYKGRYLINKEGQVWDRKHESFVDVSYDECINAVRVYLERKRKNVAKILLKVFKGRTVSSTQMVLFKDGDELNVHLDNLGITKRRRNMVHTRERKGPSDECWLGDAENYL